MAGAAIHPSADIHPTAIVDPSARIGAGVRIGAYSVVGAEVEIGDGTTIGAHCSIDGPARIGSGNRIHGHAAIGGDPQDKKFEGERTHLVVGDRNVIREFATINRGTGNGGGTTRIGAHAFIGMGAFVNGDVPPFVMVAQEGYGRPRGINAEGLKRRGFDATRIAAIKRAYRALYVSGARLDDAREQLAQLARDSDDVRALLEFIERGDRPLLR